MFVVVVLLNGTVVITVKVGVFQLDLVVTRISFDPFLKLSTRVFGIYLRDSVTRNVFLLCTEPGKMWVFGYVADHTRDTFRYFNVPVSMIVVLGQRFDFDEETVR